MSVVRFPSIEERANEAFQDYLAAREKAEVSRDLQDGIAAGRAWRRFLDIFMTGDQREALSDGSASTGRSA
ncbi:hypothetical protein [Aurantimonas sp. 22II-16-19i]|uniref:hypothetical protein n=1 Tax=Aurantimonas sp. 22II-16-19i TaxID=1317114 RepID=UPI0009F7BE68|nr:hypothetical protein [Aurantimonas sp. 22II-16-19i]ORE87717.1 hypothetical protein ATO4_25223 [Aurantimonas sp. 22II-16-19i]